MSNKRCAFTICAKNYLAQALTLKQSFESHTPGSDFYIILADNPGDILPAIDGLVLLDEIWISHWKQMAFKYNVIEFATSVKPFAFKKLFQSGYDEVLYLDPDTYVTASLIPIYDFLKKYSIVLTPHYNNIETNYTGSVTEEELLFVGIYNLGFAAIKNDATGKKIIDWWCNRLENKCYADHAEALHVDQRWMDFVPAFFPDETLITHHAGINVAIWNLHERNLLYNDNRYFVSDKVTGKKFPLLLFHFSGFDPNNTLIINRRHPRFNTATFPDFKPIINEYAANVLNNNYYSFHQMRYSFNSFENGENILHIHRRWFREYLKLNPVEENPFSTDSEFYKILRKKKLGSNLISTDINAGITNQDRKTGSKIESLFRKMTKLVVKIIGIRRFYFLLKYMEKYARSEYQFYLFSNDKTNH